MASPEPEKKRIVLILLPWLALPLVATCYLVLWSRLPDQLAVQFNFSGGVTNSLSRTASLLLDCAVLFFVLGRFSFKLWDAEGRDARVLFITYYAAVIFVTAVFLAILKYNL